MATPARPKFDFKKALATQAKNADVRKLQMQLAQQSARLAAQGGNVPSHHPGVFSRILDVVQRPNYAAANLYKTVIDKINENKAAGKGGNLSELPGLVSGGFWTGLEGKKKVHFSDVLGAGGVNNRLVRGLGGFGADVALDPLTYLGGGVEKALPAVEAGGQGAKALETAQRLGTVKRTPTALADVFNTARDTAKVGQRGAINLEFMGQPVARSEAAYNALSKIGNTPLKAGGKTLLETRPVDWANRAFRTSASYQGRLKSMMRVPLQVGISKYIGFDKALMKKFGSLTAEEASAISHAIEAGTTTGLTSKSGIKMDDVINEYLTHKARWDAEKIGAGIFRPGQGVDTYIPKKYGSLAEFQGEKAREFAKIERQVQRGLVKGTGVASTKGLSSPFPMLKDLKDAGLHPHENILDIMRLSEAEHHRAMARSMFKGTALDEYGALFKGKGKKAGVQAAEDVKLVKVPNKLIRDTHYAGKTVYAPEEVVRSFKTLDTLYKSDEETTRFVKMTDQVQRMWKTGVTTMNPAHHLRNMVGDMFLNYEAGVRNPLDYSRAMKVLTGTGTIKLGNLETDASWVKTMYNKYGGASGFFNTELLGSSTPGVWSQSVTRGVNRGLEFTREKVAQREDWMRLANFTHSLREEAAKVGAKTHAEIEQLVPKAVERVKKFNFDYGDLTKFESTVRRFVPFYTFMRKNMPLQLEMLALHPNRISRVPQGFNALQNLLGTDPQHLPITEVIPSYLKDLATFRLHGEGKGKNAVYGDVPFPIEDLGKMFSGDTSQVLRNVLSQTTPFIRMPVEMAQKQSLHSGAPINDSIPRYLGNQLGLSRNLLSQFSPKEPTHILRPGETAQANPAWNWYNWFSPVSFKEITPQVQKSELRRQQDPIQTRLRMARTQRINRAQRTGRHR